MSGCWNGRLLFSLEQPYWASLGDDLPQRLALARVTLPGGYLPRFTVTDAQGDPGARLANDVASGRFSVVMVGPLLSLEWRGFAPRFPGTRLILVGAPSSADAPSNVTFLLYDRGAAFRAAGFAAGASVRDEAPGAAPAAPGSRIALFLSSSSELAAAETEAFSSGVAEALGGPRPTLFSIDTSAEKAAVTAAVQQIRRHGAEIILLGVGSLAPWALEAMKSAGGCAVVAGWEASGAFPEQVFLSVEEDLPGGIARALAAAASGAREATGPVRTVAGKARPLSAEAKAGGEGR
jgi:hypothetical protein